jgi:hypothetical protein
MHLIGQRPVLGASGVTEAAASGATPGTPSETVLAEMSAGLGSRKLVTYQRITVGLSRDRLDQLGLPDVDPEKVREMDAVDQIPNMQRVGVAVANEQVHMERLIRFFKN